MKKIRAVIDRAYSADRQFHAVLQHPLAGGAIDRLRYTSYGIGELCAPNDVRCHSGFEFLDFDEVLDNVYVFSFIRH